MNTLSVTTSCDSPLPEAAPEAGAEAWPPFDELSDEQAAVKTRAEAASTVTDSLSFFFNLNPPMMNNDVLLSIRPQGPE